MVSKISNGSDGTLQSRRERRRSISPNNVLINGHIIDKNPIEKPLVPPNTAPLRSLLENIFEDKEQQYQSAGTPMDAIESVQKFIYEISNAKNMQTDKRFELACKNSEERLKDLKNTMATIDEASKSRIIDTLLTFFRQELINIFNKENDIVGTQKSDEAEEAGSKYKNFCSRLIKEHSVISNEKKDNLNAIQTRLDNVLVDSGVNPIPSITTAYPQNSSDSRIKESHEISNYRWKPVSSSSDPKYHQNSRFSPGALKLLEEYRTRNRQNIHLPKRFDEKGEQTTLSFKQKSVLAARDKSVKVVKPYKYHHAKLWESKSDIHHSWGRLFNEVELNRSKSDTDIKQKYREHHLDNSKKKSRESSIIKLARKASPQLIDARKRGLLKPKHMIKYLGEGLKRGDSEYHESKILYRKSLDGIGATSSIVIPEIDPKNVSNFNINYLHTLRVQRVPTENYVEVNTDPSYTEQEYLMWLKNNNLLKSSNLTKSIESSKMRSAYDETQNTSSPASNVCFPALPIDTLCRTFLCEYVVVGEFVDFLRSFSTKTHSVSILDRCFQVLLLVGLYAILSYFKAMFSLNYIYK